MTSGMVETFGEFAAGLDLEALPKTVADQLPSRVLDIVGLMVAACDLDSSAAVRSTVSALDGGGGCTALGMSRGVSVMNAAFVNGVLAHSLDFDDTHLPSIVHPSASVVPACLAVAQHGGASGSDALVAIAAGLEITLRTAMVGYLSSLDGGPGQSVFFEHGQHATSICGALGSAAACARLLGASPSEIGHAMAIAASLAAGVIESNRNGGTVKRLHCGFAAQAGVQAALLACHGITGASTALEGRFGLFEALLRSDRNDGAALDALGERWLSDTIFFKPYPANHFAHTAYDAGWYLHEQGIDLDAIEAIELGVAAPTVRTIGEPIEVKRRPETGYQAQFSGPYLVALGLAGIRRGGLGVDQSSFDDETRCNPVLAQLADKVSVTGSVVCDSIYPHQFPAVLTVHLTSGEVIRHEVLANRGGDLDPLSPPELAAKFALNASAHLSEDQRGAVCEQVSGLASAPAGSVDALMRLVNAPWMS